MLTNYIADKVTKNRIFLKINDKSDFFIFTLSIVIIIYTIYIGEINGLHYDEAYSYLKYSKKYEPGFLDISYANNHPLNSFLIYVTTFLFPYNEFAIKLPNLIFLIFYLFFSIKISNKKSSIKLIIFSFLTLYWYLIPYIFSLARGYGIATSLVLLFISRFIDDNKEIGYIISNFYILLLACYSYIGLLPLVFALTTYYLFFILKNKVILFIKKYYIDLLFIAFNLLYLTYFLSKVTSPDKPLYGAKNISFAEATLGFYINSFSTYIPNLDLITSTILVLITSIVFIYAIIKRAKYSHIIFITLVTFIIYFLLSKLLSKPYITGRLLLPLYPLVVFSFLISINHIVRKVTFIQKHLKNFGIIAFIILLFNFVLHHRVTGDEYREKIYSQRNFDAEFKIRHPSIKYYRLKLAHKLKNRANAQIKSFDDIKIKYLKDENLLVFESDLKNKKRITYYLKVYPLNRSDLNNDSSSIGFNKISLKMSYVKLIDKKYIIYKLPEYDILKFSIEQIGNENNSIWFK